MLCHYHCEGTSTVHAPINLYELNESKTRFLHTMRKQFLEDLAGMQEEIDVDHVVKRAVLVFDHDKNEIPLLRQAIICKHFLLTFRNLT